MADVRPPVPAEIRRRVLVEAGHRCAIPTCRYIEIDVHHIVPWAQSQAHKYDNLIALCPNCHRRADKGEIDRKSLRLYKLNLRFAHDKYSQLEMDILFALKEHRTIMWPSFNMILLRRILESNFLAVQQPPGQAMSFGLVISPVKISLTEKGLAFLADLGDHEL